MLEGGVPFSVVPTIMGRSPSTAVRMARHVIGTSGKLRSGKRSRLLRAKVQKLGRTPHKIPHNLRARKERLSLTD
jgi:hypothetical protein